jgi:hypothetical protein
MKKILLLILLTGCAVPINEVNDGIREDGRKANTLGIEPSANPYLGMNTIRANLWLEGWMDSEYQKKQKAEKP